MKTKRDEDRELLEGFIAAISLGLFIAIIVVSIILSIAIPMLISENNNIKKQIKLKEMEITAQQN